MTAIHTAAFVPDDGGRAAAGYKGTTGDCGVRAVAIATGRAYQDVYDGINAIAAAERHRKKRLRSNARAGVWPRTITAYLDTLDEGWRWTPTMTIGSGTRVHLRADELPPGRIIARVSKHFAAVIDGVVHDIHDPSRDGARAVYGYWSKT